MNVFLDSCTVDSILDREVSKLEPQGEEDRLYMKKLIEGPVADGIIKFFFNPTVREQITNIPDNKRERLNKLLATLQYLKFTEFNLTIFGPTAKTSFSFPAQFISQDQKTAIRQLCMKYPNLRKDEKILADSAFNKDMDVLLTTDLKLAKRKQFGRVKIMSPKELWECYEAHKSNNAF